MFSEDVKKCAQPIIDAGMAWIESSPVIHMATAAVLYGLPYIPKSEKIGDFPPIPFAKVVFLGLSFFGAVEGLFATEKVDLSKLKNKNLIVFTNSAAFTFLVSCYLKVNPLKGIALTGGAFAVFKLIESLFNKSAANTKTPSEEPEKKDENLTKENFSKIPTTEPTENPTTTT